MPLFRPSLLHRIVFSGQRRSARSKHALISNELCLLIPRLTNRSIQHEILYEEVRGNDDLITFILPSQGIMAEEAAALARCLMY